MIKGENRPTPDDCDKTENLSKHQPHNNPYPFKPPTFFCFKTCKNVCDEIRCPVSTDSENGGNGNVQGRFPDFMIALIVEYLNPVQKIGTPARFFVFNIRVKAYSANRTVHESVQFLFHRIGSRFLVLYQVHMWVLRSINCGKEVQERHCDVWDHREWECCESILLQLLTASNVQFPGSI